MAYELHQRFGDPVQTYHRNSGDFDVPSLILNTDKSGAEVEGKDTEVLHWERCILSCPLNLCALILFVGAYQGEEVGHEGVSLPEQGG